MVSPTAQYNTDENIYKMNELATIWFHTYNARGLGDGVKRKIVFDWLREKHKGIILLQETHSTVEVEKIWASQWGGKIFFSHGSSNSRGVAILITPELDCTIKEVIRDAYGRLLLLLITTFDREFVVGNVYCPTKDKPSEQENFLTCVKSHLLPLMDKEVLLGGDFNVCLIPDLDKKGGTIERQSVFAKSIHSFQEEFSLVDIWRIRHPQLARYTRREKSVRGLVQSRLDFWLVSQQLEYNIKKVDIIPGRRSDHSLVRMEYELINIDKRGKGLWKFNTSILKDENYLKKINELISSCSSKYQELEDKRLAWDTVKCEIRTETIRYTIQKARKQKELQRELETTLEKLEKELAENPSVELYAEYNVCKLELERFLANKAVGAILRSRTKWVEEGEKNSSYFLKLEHRNYKQKTITKLVNSSGREITGRDNILKEEELFYKKLYTAETDIFANSGDLENSFLVNPAITGLNEDQQDLCDARLELGECSNALKNLPNGKSPGSDGLPVEFYKVFWIQIKDLVFQAYQHSFKEGEMSIDQKRGVITLIPKTSKDLRHLSNWRPISLLNTDYKILAKALSTRLQKVLPCIINPDQTGYVKNRFIGDNIRTIDDILRFCESQRKPGIIALLDFQKALDSISWSFLTKSLQAFKFGDVLQRWIRTLYCNTSSCVTNNGYTTPFFGVERGVRQGCPISPLLFIIVAEILACKIRTEPNIKGITIKKEVYVISQLADDTSLFMDSAESWACALTVLEQFAGLSGLKLNKNKTQVYYIDGGLELDDPPVIGKKWSQNSFKTLGVIFMSDREQMSHKNFTDCYKKIKTQLNIWRQRSLSLKGKVTILKALMVPKTIYLANMLFVPRWFIRDVDKLFFDFLWDSKPSKIKKSTIIGDLREGGLKMPHIESIIQSLKLSWVKRLLVNEQNLKWKNLCCETMGLTLEELRSPASLKHIRKKCPLFYAQIVDIWSNVNIKKPENTEEVLCQPLWGNASILIEGKPITEGYKEWRVRNIKYIQDITNMNSGKILEFGELTRIHSLPLDVMKYNSLICAIPGEWKRMLQSSPAPLTFCEPQLEFPKVYVRGKWTSIDTMQNTDFYRLQIEKVFSPPTAIKKWVLIHPQLEQLNWAERFLSPYIASRSTKIQSFQYKILNRVVGCRKNLLVWNITQDNLCPECELTDTIEHRFFECHSVERMWKNFEVWFQNATSTQINLDVLTILLGTNNEGTDGLLLLLDFCICIGKWYIHREKQQDKPISFLNFLFELKKHIDIEKTQLSLEGKIEVFNSKWKCLYESI